MSTPLVVSPTATRTAARKSLSALAQWTLATLIVAEVMLVYFQAVLYRGFVLQVALILQVPALIIIGLLLTTHWRWTPLLAVPFWLLAEGSEARFIAYDIRHPESYGPFSFTVVLLVVAAVGVVASIGATMQNYRATAATETDNGRRQLPAWFRPLPWLLAGLGAGALLVGALPGPSTSGAVSAEAMAALPANSVTNLTLAVTEGRQYDQPQLRVKAGATVALRLENHDNIWHTFNIDELNVHVPIPTGKPNFVLFTPTQPGNYRFHSDIPGFNEAGTLIVEP